MENGVKRWEGPERRTNVRLRKVIDELQGAVHQNRTAIEEIDRRISELAQEIEVLKNALT